MGVDFINVFSDVSLPCLIKWSNAMHKGVDIQRNSWSVVLKVLDERRVECAGINKNKVKLFDDLDLSIVKTCGGGASFDGKFVLYNGIRVHEIKELSDEQLAVIIAEAL